MADIDGRAPSTMIDITEGDPMTRFRTLAVAALLAVSTALSACVQVRADSGKAAWCITGPTGALVTDGDGWCWIPAAVYPTIDLPSDPPPYPTTGT